MKKCIALLLVALLVCANAGAWGFQNDSFLNAPLYDSGGYGSFYNDSLYGSGYGSFVTDGFLNSPSSGSESSSSGGSFYNDSFYGSGGFLNDSYLQDKPQKNVLVDGKPWLPDPAGVLGTAAEEQGGKYIYRTALAADELNWVFLAYADCLEGYGYSHQAYTHESALYFMRFTHEAGEADLAAYADGGLLRFELEVSDGLGFEAGSYPAEMGKCIECLGSGDCEYCLSGRANYGDGYEDCSICDGSGVCNICDGTGRF